MSRDTDGPGDADSGLVLAYVGGDPADRDDQFDRARKARRQPGSAIKPLLLRPGKMALRSSRSLIWS